jgi:hypothetical protein
MDLDQAHEEGLQSVLGVVGTTERQTGVAIGCPL